jgi:hypothetical protein
MLHLRHESAATMWDEFPDGCDFDSGGATHARVAAGDSSYAAKLRARAERYSRLAETLSDPNIVRVVKECIRELKEEAAAQERAAEKQLLQSEN